MVSSNTDGYLIFVRPTDRFERHIIFISSVSMLNMKKKYIEFRTTDEMTMIIIEQLENISTCTEYFKQVISCDIFNIQTKNSEIYYRVIEWPYKMVEKP